MKENNLFVLRPFRLILRDAEDLFRERIEAPNKTEVLDSIFKGYDKRMRPDYRGKCNSLCHNECYPLIARSSSPRNSNGRNQRESRLVCNRSHSCEMRCGEADQTCSL